MLQQLGCDACFTLIDKRPRQSIHSRKVREGAVGKKRKPAVKRGRHILGNFTQHLLDDVEIVQQPFGHVSMRGVVVNDARERGVRMLEGLSPARKLDRIVNVASATFRALMGRRKLPREQLYAIILQRIVRWAQSPLFIRLRRGHPLMALALLCHQLRLGRLNFFVRQVLQDKQWGGAVFDEGSADAAVRPLALARITVGA